jgi:hypothetical protein
LAAQNSYCNSREDKSSAKKGKSKKTKTWLLRLEKNPDLEEKGGNDELKAINEIDGKTRQVEDLSDSSSC